MLKKSPDGRIPVFTLLIAPVSLACAAPANKQAHNTPILYLISIFFLQDLELINITRKTAVQITAEIANNDSAVETMQILARLTVRQVSGLLRVQSRQKKWLLKNGPAWSGDAQAPQSFEPSSPYMDNLAMHKVL